MRRRLTVGAETWPIRGVFRIARGARTDAEVVTVTIADDRAVGRGECVPYARYGESVASVIATIEKVRDEIETGLARAALPRLLPPGAARNALDCALIDWESKASGRRAFELLGLPAPKPVRTAYTLSLDQPAAMAQAAAQAARKGYGLLKLKIAGQGDLERIEAVRAAVPFAQLIVDANEGWTASDLESLAPALGALGVTLIEQPLRAEDDVVLSDLRSPVPLCADESCHTRADLPRLAGRYDYINIKLDKAGGLSEAAALAREARAMGFRLMVGCMVATSLSIAPAILVAGLAELADLDGPLLLVSDRTPALRYEGDLLHPPPPELWG